MEKNQYTVKQTESKHVDLTNSITILCLERSLMRIKAQIKYSEKIAPEQIKNYLKDFKIIVKAINIIKFYK